MAQTTEQMKQESYASVKEQLDAAFAKGGIPNIKAFKATIASLRKRIRNVEQGVVFALSLEEVRNAEMVIAMLQGQRQAYQERLDWINEKIKSF